MEEEGAAEPPQPESQSGSQTTENHIASQILQQLLDSNQITNEVFRDLSFKLSKLQQAFELSCSHEHVLMRRAREYSKELKSQKLIIQNTAQEQQDHRSLLTSLRQFVTNIQAEVEATQEQITSTDRNTRAKLKEKEKLEEKVANAREIEASKITPSKDQIQIEISDLEKAITEIKQKIMNMCKFGDDVTDRIAKADLQLMELEKKKRLSNQKVLDISSIPIKTKAKCAQVESNHNSILAEEKNANTQLQSFENSLYQSQTKAHDYEVESQHVSNDIEKINIEISTMKKQFDDLKKKESERTSYKQQLEFDNRKASKQIYELDKEVSNLDQKIDQICLDTDKKQQETLKMEEMISRLNSEKTSLESQKKTVDSDKQREIDHILKLKKEYESQLAAKEDALKALMEMEAKNEKIYQQINLVHEERERKQRILDTLSLKERDLTQELAKASISRDRKAREMALMKKKVRDSKNLAMERNLNYLDLCRKLEQDQIRMREFAELYERVKVDRNRHVNTIQSSKHLIVEMKEKIKILENETEVLRSEFEQIAIAVKLQKNQLSEAFKKRDKTRADLKKAEDFYKELMSKIDFQAGETDRLNHILHSLEDQINYQQGRYSAQADDCADRQRMLIDKQDELCIIYEQFNRHQEIMRQGEVAITEKEEEIKLLNNQLRDFTRRIDIMQRKIPQLRSYKEEIRKLKKQIRVEKKEVDDLTQKIEIPNLKERKRAYCGRDFTLKELEDKVSLYEQRINSKEQQLWEKQILLREIQDKINAVNADSGPDGARTAKILERGGKIRAETMATRRKKLATLSELAIYQAQKVELQRQTEEIKQEINEAAERTARGEAFDEYSARILRMETRDMYIRSQQSKREQFLDDEDDEDKPKGRQKYDAYPTADGLSRPYGAFPVFQPAPPPGYIRHYRKEAPIPIEM